MFTCNKQGGVFVISGSAPLNGSHVAEAAALFDQCVSGGQPRIVLNLQGIPLIDSSGLELLLDVGERCQNRGGALVLAAPSPLCRDILRVAGLPSQIAVFDDATSAAGVFSQ
jgi:anti-sigma B factor antagonist